MMASKILMMSSRTTLLLTNHNRNSYYHQSTRWLLFISLFISSLASNSLLNIETTSLFDEFRIPDQQAFIGKLFYYQIEIPNDVKNFTLTQAGSNIDSNNRLPDWLYFDHSTGLLFGAPQEKRIYFIQVEAMQNSRKYEDIFVIETLDRPAYLLNGLYRWQDQSMRQSSYFHQCRIDLKQNFPTVKQIFNTIVIDLYQSFFKHSDQTFQNEQTLKQWLNQFNVQAVFGDISGHGSTLNKEYHLFYDVKECETESNGKLQLDTNSQLLLKQLKRSNIDSELIKITHGTIPTDSNDDIQFNVDANRIDPSISLAPSSDSTHHLNNHHHEHDHHHHHHHHHKKREHRRRNAYADDENIYETPALNKELWSTSTTSTIDYSLSNVDQMTALSRTVIPSMVSPTFTRLASDEIPGGFGEQFHRIQPTPTIQTQESTRSGHQLHLHIPSYPHLYRTPVLVPELISQSVNLAFDNINDNLDQQSPLFTPIFTTSTMSTLQPSATIDSTQSRGSSSNYDESKPFTAIDSNDLGKISIDSGNINLYNSSTSTTTSTSTTEHSTTILNHRPFVNKRISKLSITAGKFWQFTIPEDTFYDKEDGNTRQLRIGFFMDSEILPADYWIQFDNENQYLYALPTDDNIGRYRFNLVAVDLQGGEATEILEIYVRQSRQSLSYTHKFILANMTWDNDRYPERIQAVSSILQRMSIQVFEEMPSGGLTEAAQRQALLRHINVLNIQQNPESLQWSITWTNDSLRRHPCPVNEINLLFSRLYDITYPEDEFGFMSPSHELRSAVSPDFKIEHVKRIFIGRSACGSYATAVDSASASRHKDKIVFSNRLNRIGPYRLGSAFKFQIPKDTVYSMTRQVDTRQLALSVAPLEPEIDLPEFIYFDTHEQTIYGLPYKPEHIRTYELKLIAEDTVHGGSEHDIFILDVEHDVNTREDYLFEITMNFLYRNIELTSRSQQRLTSKDFYEVAHALSTRLMGNSNLEAFRMLDISRHRFTKIAEPVEHLPYINSNVLLENYEVTSNSLLLEDDIDKNVEHHVSENEKQVKRHLHHHHHHHPHDKRLNNHHETSLIRPVRAISSLQSDYFYEFVWTNRTLVTSYSHSQNALGGGSIFETKTCPKKIIQEDIYHRLFPRNTQEFLSNVNLNNNITSMDVLDIYNQLFDPLEANLKFLSVEWIPKSVCSNSPGLENRVLGAKPIRDTSAEDDDDEDESVNLDDSIAAAETEDPSINISMNPDDNETPDVDEYPNMHYFGDRLLAMLIPPIAILIALLFAVTIGCCFHRANQRRKAMGAMAPYHDESPTLYRQRIPIQLEFERGGLRGSGIHPSEQESMLDSKFGRHPVQIMPPKLRGGPPSNLPAAQAAASHHGHNPGGPLRHPNLPYQMLPQQ
ncbi:Dystroglycan (Dystrophin-associated glycoprotein 1) [Dermatophagoides pteronyssinus]|uniref:Dystroglycan (Dystrophin-associated glycoprotein 1) n=1 Tax=Dermatophagoides pteronyssinus TaxID=6956 RepID=A0ABQ8J4X1_DERPT|nr:Dystroglycan (Dystrophin-associated glycoprotein 1) [Dermatophagoides pteronyssinus]